MTKRAEITVEIRRLTVVRKSGHKRCRAFCELCAAETEMMTTDRAALFAKCSSRAIFGWVELGWLHFAETDDRLLLVCRTSLRDLLKVK